jgi:hypothetical protein
VRVKEDGAEQEVQVLNSFTTEEEFIKMSPKANFQEHSEDCSDMLDVLFFCIAVDE